MFLQVYACGSPGGGGGEINFDTPVINPFNLANVSVGAFPCFVDINNDGDLDAFVGEDFGDTYYFENILY
jgi:hypothetical protein